MWAVIYKDSNNEWNFAISTIFKYRQNAEARANIHRSRTNLTTSVVRLEEVSRLGHLAGLRR